MLGQKCGQSTTGTEERKPLRSPEEIVRSLRLTRTPTYQWILLQQEHRLLQEVAESIRSLAEAEAKQRSAEEEFCRIEHTLQKTWDKKLADGKERRDAAEHELRQAEQAVDQLHRTLRAARNRVAKIRARDLMSEDWAIVEQTAQKKCAPFEERLDQLGRECESLQNEVRLRETQQADLKAQWEKVQREAEYWDSGTWPPEVGAAIEKAAQEARAAHQKEVAQLDKEIAALETKLSEVRANKHNLAREIDRLHREVEQDKGKSGLWHWLARFLYDPAAALAKAQSRYNEMVKEESQVANALEQAKSKRDDLLGQEGERIAAARRREQERQYGAFVEKRKRVSDELGECENALAGARSALQGVLTRIEQCEKEREQALAQAIEDAWQKLLTEAEEALEAAQKEYDAARESKVGAERNLAEAESSLERLKKQEHKALESGLAEPHRRVRECRAECERWRQEVTLRLQECGVTVPESAQAAEIAHLWEDRRNEVSRLLEQWDGHMGPKSDSVRGRVVSSCVASSQESAVAEGALYLDFDKNAEDNSDPQGNLWPGLNTQLKAVLERYGKTDTQLTEEPLAWFRMTFFPEGLVRSYFVCNISYQQDQPYLLIRPTDITPRMEEVLPPGVVLGICGRLYDNRVDPDNPVLLVQRIVDVSHCPRRAFEREIRVIARTNEIYPGRLRRQNVLTRSFVEALPPISVETEKRLDDWWEYLNWKETLAKKSLDGVRYVQVALDREGPEGRLRFLVVAPDWERMRRILRQDEVRAYPLEYSRDPWTFDYNDDCRPQEVELGDFVTVERISALPDEANITSTPWENPVWAWAVYRLSESAEEDFDQMREEGASWERIEEAVLRRVPRQGFLSLSIVGELALVNRQRTALKRLQEQGGYAPLLSSYLFDIQAANQPADLIPIPDDRWFRKDLNNDQKLAVRKMISAPDLALVQGPPGTGKTTMIAEAICHLVEQRKTVLVASQANLAVDNALERLVGFPSIRAIRLGQRADENCPFSKSKALTTYYQAIAKTCREEILQPWEEAERTVRELQAWLNQVEIVAADLAAMEQEQHSLAHRRDEILAAINTSRQEEVQSRQLAEQRERAKEFLAFLKEETDSPGELPTEIAAEVLGQLSPLVQKLRTVGIELDPEQVTRIPLSAWQQSLGLLEIFRRWQEVDKYVPQLEEDAKRLAALDGESILSQGDALLLNELERRARQLLEEMTEDGSKLAEWQAVQKRIRDLRKRGSGLNAEVYGAVFNAEVDGVPVARQFTNPQARRQEVLARLREALRAIGEVRQEMALVYETCQRKVEEFVNATAPRESVAEQRRQYEIELADVTDRLASLEKEIAEKEARLVELLGRHGGIHEEAPTRQALPRIREGVRNQLERLTRFLREQEPIRKAWGEILEVWTRSLMDPTVAERDRHQFFPVYLQACNVVGVTCTENPKTLEEDGFVRFDVAIVDEVSKATPPEMVMPLLLARTAILVGDHRQLPPLFRERELPWEELVAEAEEDDEENGQEFVPLTRETFERFRKLVTASLFKEHFENASETLKSFLFTQYRMHPQIMKVINHFYENRLVCGLQDPDGDHPNSDPREHRLHNLTLLGPRRRPYLCPREHVLWIDSSVDPLGKPHFEERTGSGGKTNALEALLIAQCLYDMEMAYRELGFGPGKKPPRRVGVITFYARQVRTIRETLRRFQKKHAFQFQAIRVDINTVDRYQGQERPIVLVSLVRNPRHRLSRRANTAQFERINVAFSRAQELLVIVGAERSFRHYPVKLPHLDRPGYREIEVYRHIIEEIERWGCFRSSADIVSVETYREFQPQAGRAPQGITRGGKPWPSV